MLRHCAICVSCLLAFAGATAHAQLTVHVDDDCPTPPGTGTETDPFCNIQDAICTVRTTPPATVLVHPGTYNEAIRMFAGVSVMSTDGPAVTTIDAGTPAVKACITSTCTVSAVTPCAVVYFPSASPSTNADRLEGFRLVGGGGINQTCGGSCNFQAGGGIYIFGSSPTITMNEIVGNVLYPGPNMDGRDYLKGGGIYVQAGIGATPPTPMITQNLIEGNVANAVSGSGSVATRYSMGGGIYVGDNAEGTIADNTIRDNLSGTTKERHRGGGGGIAVYSLIAYGAQPVITRNLIQSNEASDCGGGVSLSYGYSGSSDALVENNLIEMNDSPAAGAGVWTGGTRAKIRSNTITDNTATNGGGIHAGISLGADQITLVNNLFTFNTVTGTGGGIHVEPLAQGQADPTVRFNDIYGNSPNNVGGAKTDPDYIGVDSNVSVDPLYVDRVDPDRDYRLQESSPVIDAGDSTEASALDLDGNQRVVGAAIDLGAWEFFSATDTDGDGIPDSLDPDDDNDGVPDESDCASLAAGVTQPPDPVGSTLTLDKNGGGRLRWLRSLQGHTYNVYRGTFGAGQPWSYNEVCLVSEVPGSIHVDPVDPVNPDEGFYYLIAARNVCGDAVAGLDSLGSPIVPAAACPSLNLDGDSDLHSDVADNCPTDSNASQGDQDADFVGNACDNCLTLWNPDQGDPDDDARGNACDNCPAVANAGQEDEDVDQVGDLCDNCVSVANPGQGDADVDTLGDDCDLCTDTDGDGFGNPGFPANTCATDNCPDVVNLGQEDFEMDGLGDDCDADDDNDFVDDELDCAPFDASASSPPQEVADLSVSQAPSTTLGWVDQGFGFRYDVASGLISVLLAQQATTSAECIQNDVGGSSFVDGRPDPDPDDGYFYMVRSQNACGTATYGFSSSGAEHFAGTDCP